MTDEKPAPRWVTAQDVRDAAYGLYISDDELAQLEKLVLRAERLIVSRVPNLEQRIADGRLSVDTVRGVVERMVLRVVRNPDGVQSDSTGGVSTAFWRNSASGVIELLQEDLADLMPPTRRYGSMRVGLPSWRVP